MNVHASLLGIYEPEDRWLFRLAASWKYLLVLVPTLATFLVWRWWFTLAMLTLVLGLLRSSGISPRKALRLGSMLWIVIALLVVYQLLTLRLDLAVTSPGSVLVAVLAARILTLTTSTPELLDALIKGLSPLHLIGVNVEQLALTVAIMVRSIPYLIGSFEDSREAARARGRDGNPISVMIPTMVAAVAYAQSTGEALHARGLAEREGQ